MIKTLMVNGCSWTAGNELEQDVEFDNIIKANGLAKQDATDPLNWNLVDTDGNPVATYDDLYNMLNWAGYLKDKLGVEQLVNLSTGGGSNTRILRTTIDYVMSLTPEQCQETMIVIGWTVSERDEIHVSGAWQRWNATQPFEMTVDRTLITDDQLIEKVNRIQEDFILYINSDYASVKRYFQQTYLLANLLENLGIKYFFFNALPAWWSAGNLAFDVDVHNEFPDNLIWHENQRTILSNNDTMYKFVNANAWPQGQYMHPLSQGHLAWANYLFMIMQERGIV
jgi:hypothetical protein